MKYFLKFYLNEFRNRSLHKQSNLKITITETKVQSQHNSKLPIQSQQQEHQSKMWKMLKADNKDTRDISFYCDIPACSLL